ncbi:unnamed protein product [Arabidopsis lyrata]|nr:expressed protein [Arabidopsis lyrata subsp. lyrata]CAH8261099.1 unnamed protein product [Arabidopsis lyrata]
MPCSKLSNLALSFDSDGLRPPETPFSRCVIVVRRCSGQWSRSFSLFAESHRSSSMSP